MLEKLRPTIFYIIFFLFVLAFSTTATNYDYDLWARLIVGMNFFQTGQILNQDFLSYAPTHIWIDHEWGSGVIFYLVQHFLHSAGILAFQALLIFMTFFFITKIIELRGVKTTHSYNFLFYYFAFIAMADNVNIPIRCQLFSFLFFTVFLYLLELARGGKSKYLWLMPLIMIFWNNLHGGCVSGIGLIIIYVLGEFLNRKPIKQYIYPLVATVAVLLINPWGISYIKFLLEANLMQRPDVSEWFGLFSKFFLFKYIKFKIFALILILIEVYTIVKQFLSKNVNFDYTKLLVVVITLFLAIQHVKLIPFAVISMTCFLYDDFYSVFNSLTRNLFNKISQIKDFIIYFIIMIFAVANIYLKISTPLVNFSRYPVLAVEFIKVNNIKGNLLLNFGLSSYAGYKLYPNNKIFIDGRYEEVYYVEMMPLLRKFYTVSTDWNEILKKYPPDVMIIERYYPVSEVLSKDKTWKAVFTDNLYVVFVKSKNAQKTYKKPRLDINYYKKTVFDTDINFVLQSKDESEQ